MSALKKITYAEAKSLKGLGITIKDEWMRISINSRGDYEFKLLKLNNGVS